MEHQYSQAILNRFTRYARLKGSGFRSIAADVGRVVIPFARKVLLPALKSIGEELFAQSLRELIDVASRTESIKLAAKSAVRKTVPEKTVARWNRVGLGLYNYCKQRITNFLNNTHRFGVYSLQYNGK